MDGASELTSAQRCLGRKGKVSKLRVWILAGDIFLVILDSRHKPVESLWFRFPTFKSTDLCMSYDGYQDVGLKEATRRSPWCKCK